ncbi:tyrosine-protein phosphatase non-receptor type 12-like isoform X3 [Haliotis asinina]|uniref:tyrosine-protein phosphatase non-receptor type 12-like isoform X3 n=1 Tax=Haliotis asinina TaxID=109174 RepID=UPI003531EB0A
MSKVVELREIQIANKNENKYPSEEGKKECNIKKNRYKDILPYDYRRVVLSKQDGVEGSDYINASFIQDVYGKNGYIASQGPLPHTVSDFWRMLWEYKVEIVFMVCREEESGRPKCERYWALEGEAKMFGHLEVTLESEKELFPDFVERILRVCHGGEKHVVKQFHYTGWPDHGVPHHSQEIYKMVGKMREERRLLEIPIVIHCSAGCGRTGTICAVDYAWTLLDQNKVSHGFSLYEVIRNIRQQRQSMVQTPDQYEFAHLVVQSLCEDWINLFQEHDYYNTEIIASAQDDEQKTSKRLPSTPFPSSPPPTPTHTEGSRKPQPLPRPVLDVKTSGDKYENVVIRPPSVKGPKKQLRAVSDSGHAYDNQKPFKTGDPKASAVSKTTSLPTPLKQTSPKTQEKQPRTQAAPTTKPNVSGTNTVPKAGHSTTVNVSGTKYEAKKTFAPQPPTTQVNVHKAGVLNLGHVGGQMQVAANRKLPSEATNGQADVYGEVVKNPGKPGSSPDVSRSALQHGQKKRGGAVKKVVHKAEFIQSYENFPLPGRRCESYENFPLAPAETSTSGPDKPLEDGAPELPSRGYSEEEAATDLFPPPPPPSSGFGTVGALGGVVSSPRSRLDSSGASSSSRTLDSSSSYSPVIRSVASSVESVYSEISNVQPTPIRTEVLSASRVPNQQHFQSQNNTSFGATSRSPFGIMKDMLNIRNPRSGVQVVQAVPGVYKFRGQDVGFANRPQKPKGKKEEPRYWKTYM